MHTLLALGISFVGMCWVSMVTNFDTVVLRHFDPVDRVLLLIKHFCAEGLCFFPGEYLFLSARLQAGCAARGFACQTCSWVRRGNLWQVSVRTLVEKKGYLAFEGGNMLDLASLGPLCPWGL